VAALLEAARRERSAAERTADAAARRLVPAVVAVALAAGGWWTAHDGLGRGILVALAVLVVACPCALGIATPVAVWTGLVAAARRGAIVRSAPVLERLATLRTVCFDKTGTLTERVPRLVAIEAGAGRTAEDVLARVAALERGLAHPVARAVARAAAERGLVVAAARGVRAVPGRGVRGEVDGAACAAGSAAFAAEELGGAALAGDDRIFVLEGGRMAGALRLAESPRPDARAALDALRALGVRPRLLTGDARADAVVPALLSAGDAATGLRPADKLARLRALGTGGPVAMVGDGLNDAPALAAADVGVAVADAADLARLAADVVVVRDDLGTLPWLVAHARRVARVARQNLAWAFGYNAIAVGLAAAGRLDPLVAALAMIGSSAGVVANARRLARP
jgi:Cu2+-exporting ATPase